VSSVLAGGSGLIKGTSGMVILSGSNVFTGLTNVQEGVLRMGASERLANSS
jgi:autotransporter-associated beta strand protein